MLTESRPASWQVRQPLLGGGAYVRCAQTTPPKRFTDGTLISAMTHIHRFVHSDADRKIFARVEGDRHGTHTGCHHRTAKAAPLCGAREERRVASHRAR